LNLDNLMPLTGEYPARIERARSLMAEQGIDALLLLTGPNLMYFTGMPYGRSGSRPFVYVLPADGNPTLIVQNGRQFETHVFTGVGDIRTYSRLSHLPLTVIQGALEDRGLPHGRIGVELGGEMVMDIPFGEFLALQGALPDVSFVDASSLLWQLRTIKSPAEIERVARACEITLEAYDHTFGIVEPGMSEAAIERVMITHMLELGGGSPWVLITSGAGNYDLVSKGGSSRRVEMGDMVWMDSGCQVDGYFSDFGRAGVLGGPSPAQEEAQHAIHQITHAAITLMQPGAATADIAVFCNEAVRALDLPITSNISGLAARVGHGLGTVVTEQPSLAEDDSTLLAPGMILTIEPGIATDYGTFHIEENVLITSNGPRVLTEGHWQLWTI
jgi:Xaa-Pro dipeptidase